MKLKDGFVTHMFRVYKGIFISRKKLKKEIQVLEKHNYQSED